MFYKIRLYFLLVVFLCLNCNVKEKGIAIEVSTELDIYVTVKDNQRGVTYLNNKYALVSNCALIYKDSFPKWIKERGLPVYLSQKAKFTPSIGDINAPFSIKKKANENYFYVYKNRDTLKFNLIKL